MHGYAKALIMIPNVEIERKCSRLSASFLKVEVKGPDINIRWDGEREAQQGEKLSKNVLTLEQETACPVQFRIEIIMCCKYAGIAFTSAGRTFTDLRLTTM